MNDVKINGVTGFNGIKPTNRVEVFVRDYMQNWANQNLLAYSAPYSYDVLFSRELGGSFVECEICIVSKFGEKWEESVEGTGWNVKNAFTNCLQGLDPFEGLLFEETFVANRPKRDHSLSRF